MMRKNLGAGDILMPRAVAKLIPALGAARAKPDPTCWLKLHTLDGDWAWWVIEYSPRARIAYGLVQGHVLELGEFSVADLEAARGPGGLRIQRVVGWPAQRLSVVRQFEAREPKEAKA